MIAQFRLPVAGVCDRSQLQAFPRIWLPRSRRAGALNFACVNTFARMSSPGMVTMDGGKRRWQKKNLFQEVDVYYLAGVIIVNAIFKYRGMNWSAQRK